MDSKNETDLKGLRHPTEYLKFIAWIATTEALRTPKTQKEFAAEIGTGEDVLSDWKKREGFWDSVKKEIKTQNIERTTDILCGLYKKALTGNAAEVKLWFQLVEGWSEKQQAFDNEVRHVVLTRGEHCTHNIDKEYKNGIIEP